VLSDSRTVRRFTPPAVHELELEER
jgi:hypothetical protein